MTLVQLRYFQAECEYGSTSQAAEKMNLSQPSVSSAIKALESEFRVTLFYRQRKGMELTEAGEAFLKLANQLLLHADRVAASMQNIGRKSREVRLGVPPMIGSLYLPQIYQSFLAAAQDYQIAV